MIPFILKMWIISLTGYLNNMSVINFYQLSKTPVEEALPVLLEKILSANGRAIVLCKDKKLLKNLDEALWSVGGTRFIPHGTEAEDFKEQQPIFLTPTNDNPNNAKFLVHIGVISDDNYKDFEKTLMIFNQADMSETQSARDLWKKLKSDDTNELKYFKQNEKGGWEEAA